MSGSEGRLAPLSQPPAFTNNAAKSLAWPAMWSRFMMGFYTGGEVVW